MTGLRTQASFRTLCHRENCMNSESLIHLDNIKKVFLTDEVETHALAGVHFGIARGEYVSISGPSGCGKSTLLAILGLLDTPTVNQGKVKVVLHLLSPGYKPVQVTQDLRSFWQNTYAEVRKELRRRYPKHSWPEDPWTAVPVRGVRRKTDQGS